MRSGRGFELAARPVDWITLKCCCDVSVRERELCRAAGDVWDKAGGETQRGKGTRVGGLEETFGVCVFFFSCVFPHSGLSFFAFPVLGIKT